MLGHAEKEKRKYETAQATIAAADAGTQAAYEKYQAALVKAGGDVNDPTAKAAYDAYQGVFAQGKAAKAQFAIPDKGQGKKSGGQGGQKGKDSKKSLGGGIKEFFEANPHIVPQIALMTMQPQAPGLSSANQEEVDRQKNNKLVESQNQLILEQQRQRRDDENVAAQYAGLTQEQINALPADEQKKLTAAKYRISLEQPKGLKYDIYTDEMGNYHSIPEGTEVPPGWKLHEKTPASMQNKLGTVGDFIETVGRDNKMDVDKLSAQQKGYLESMWHFFQQNPSASSATSWYLDDKGNWQTRTQPGYRGPTPPHPPPGVFPPNFIWPGTQANQAAPAAQPGVQPGKKITAPPQRAATKPAAGGQPTAPPQKPGAQPKRSWQAATNTQRVETEQKDRYAKAEVNYNRAIKDAQTAFQNAKIDQTEYNRRVAKAQLDLNDEKREIERWYAGQVHAVGGTVPSDSGFNFADYPTAN